MTNNEIEQAAKEFHKSHFKSEELSRLEVSGYIQGMIMVNERQPFTLEMVAKIVWAGWRPTDQYGLTWWNKYTENVISHTQLLNLYKETK